MNLKAKSKQLLTNHYTLGNKLIEIPSTRNLTYKEVLEDGYLIAKILKDNFNIELTEDCYHQCKIQ